MQLQRRPTGNGELLPTSLPPLLRRIYSQRNIQDPQELEYQLAKLCPYQSLMNVEQAAILLSLTIEQQRRIVVVGDFDADGATSTALAVHALRSMGAKQVQFVLPDRFKEGYGLSCEVVERVAKLGAELIMTVDNGISAHAAVLSAKQKGIKVIVTDHHLPGDSLPEADVIVNPMQPGCQFPSKTLAGVGVVFYLMMALRAHLRQTGWFDKQRLAIPNLAELLDLVALGTIADIVPLDRNNRILVHQGLSRIRAGFVRPGIQALLESAQCDPAKLVTGDLAFYVSPRLNAAGRLESMTIGVELLLCQHIDQARELANRINELNQTRQEIEQTMEEEALLLCRQLEQEHQQIPHALAIYHPDWHQGVIGIVASRIKDRFHRPVIAFATDADGLLRGSGRSIPGLHLRDILERIHVMNPGLIIRFGGHAMAAGLSIPQERFNEFCQCFDTLISERLDGEELQGVIWSDGELKREELTMESAELIRYAGPWGQSFPEPVFDGQFRILQQRLLKEKHLKLLLEPLAGGPMVEGIFFNINKQYWTDNRIQQATLAYQLEINEYLGKRKIQLLIRHIWPL